MKQYTLLTSSGINKLLKTASDGSKIALKEIVVSDYDGELSEQTTSIPNEKYRGAINAITIDENDNNILDVDAIIPPEVGGFYIKTAGIYCDDGSLFAVARLADTYKPLLNEGSSKDITLNFKLQISNANESIILKVDNNVVLATRKWCEKMFLKIKDKIDAYTKEQSDDKFVTKEDIATEAKAGIFKITNEITGSRNDVVVTEAAVANNTMSFEPYNKVDVDFIGIKNAKDISKDPDPFKDGSGEALYNFIEGGKDLAGKHNSTAQLTPVDGGVFGGKALSGKNNYKPLGITLNLPKWTISFWTNDRGNSTSNRMLLLFNSGNQNYTRQMYFRATGANEAIAFNTYRSDKWVKIEGNQIKNDEGGWRLVTEKAPSDEWYHVAASYDGEHIVYYLNGVRQGKVQVGPGLNLTPSYNNTWIAYSFSSEERGVLSQVRIFNRVLEDDKLQILFTESISSENTNLYVEGITYISDKASAPGRYLNTATKLRAFVPAKQQKPSGTYFVKVKQDNSLELVSIRPEFHHKSTTAEYYLDGVWYDKSGNKLPSQTYLPYSVTITANNITAFNFENIYPSSKELGVGQRWINEKPNRQNNFTYKNETGRSIQISCYVNTVSIQTSQDGINWVSHPAASTAGECEIIIPAGYFYKTANVGPQWLELK